MDLVAWVNSLDPETYHLLDALVTNIPCVILFLVCLRNWIKENNSDEELK